MNNLATASQRMIDYKPGLVGKTARVLIPLLQSVLPSSAFKSAYDGLYWMNKRRIWAAYSLRSMLTAPFATPEAQLRQKLTRQLLPYTMGGPKALENAFDLAMRMQAENIEGDIVECGVAQGGTAAMLALASDATGSRRRHFWYFDSYEGLPEPTEEDYKGTRAGQYVQPLVKGSCLGTIEQVSELLFDKLKIGQDRVTLVKGWFQDTVFPNRDKIGTIAILRLDGDWYESTKIPLEGFYEKIAPGGAVIIDDYATCYGSEKAVEEFLAERGITVDLRPDGRGGAWFIKPH